MIRSFSLLTAMKESNPQTYKKDFYICRDITGKSTKHSSENGANLKQEKIEWNRLRGSWKNMIW